MIKIIYILVVIFLFFSCFSKNYKKLEDDKLAYFKSEKLKTVYIFTNNDKFKDYKIISEIYPSYKQVIIKINDSLYLIDSYFLNEILKNQDEKNNNSIVIDFHKIEPQTIEIIDKRLLDYFDLQYFILKVKIINYKIISYEIVGALD